MSQKLLTLGEPYRL